MMNRLILLVFLFSFLACKSNDGSNGNDGIKRNKAANDIEENIYRSADSMMTAFKRQDWQTFASYNHPAMMRMMGGAENFVFFIKEQMKHIPDTAIKVMAAGNILQVVKTETDHQCVLEQHMHMLLEGININTTTYLVGESVDEGKNWTFFDASSNGLVTPKDIKPNLSNELNIPAQKKEVKQLQ
ncbi:hypothetical protein [Aridibaculum aurantiacum]|uniref:hypothetical protein n=1 Tax=Aridibaculum aurantiacum TaxID=2810307 RepID=UPI001A9579D5|nr:hypothetical protein [Aridibaculum aurantiacum]